jgi:hypothetical protein
MVLLSHFGSVHQLERENDQQLRQHEARPANYKVISLYGSVVVVGLHVVALTQIAS